MSCAACTFALASPTDRVKCVNDCNPVICGCEAYSVSEHSPGRVVECEPLHYLVRAPDARLSNGKLNPIFLRQIEADGLSVLRDSASDGEFQATHRELKERWAVNLRSLEGIMSFPAASVKHDEDQRLCCVYDTGLPDKPHHADVMAPRYTGDPLSRADDKKMRFQRIQKLVDKIGTNFTPASQFRGGIFSDSET